MKAKLLEALGDCKFVVSCICVEKSSFENITNSTFFVYDELDSTLQRPVRVVTNMSNYQLTVNNPSNNHICLIKTDKCLFTDETKKCDCILFDNQQFFMVEIKTASSGAKSKRRKDAVKQLEITIGLLKEKSIDLSSHTTTALICFKSNEPRIIQASRNSSAAIFKEKYGIRLQEGNVIDF